MLKVIAETSAAGALRWSHSGVHVQRCFFSAEAGADKVVSEGGHSSVDAYQGESAGPSRPKGTISFGADTAPVLYRQVGTGALGQHFAIYNRSKRIESIEDLVGHDAEEVAELRKALAARSVSEASWLTWRKALVSLLHERATWSDVLADMTSQDNNAEWPAFILSRSLKRVYTMSEAGSATKSLAANVHLYRRDVATKSVIMLAERAFDRRIQALHLAREITDIAIALATRLAEEMYKLSDEAVERRQRKHDRIEVFLARYLSRLLRYDDDRARENALRVLETAEATLPAPPGLLFRQLFGVSYKRTGYRNRWLTVDMAEHLFEAMARLNLAPDEDMYHAAMNAAGRAGNVQKARQWLLAVRTIRLGKSPLPDRAHRNRVPVSPDLSDALDERSLPTPSNTSYLAALAHADDFESGIAHFDRLLQARGQSDNFRALVGIIKQSTWDWSNFLSMAARMDSIDPMTVLSMMEPLPASNPSPNKVRSDGDEPRLDCNSFAMVMNGFFERGLHDSALATWNAMIKRKILPNDLALAALCKVLLKCGQSAEALRQLQKWIKPGIRERKLMDGRRGDASAASAIPSDPQSAEEESHKIPASIDLMNSVLESLGRANESLAAYKLWKMMYPKLNVAPNEKTLSTLLSIAYGSHTRGSRTDSEPTLWAATPAAWTARRIFRSQLFGQHPELETCLNPLEGADQGWVLRGEMGIHNFKTWMGGRVRQFVGSDRAKQSRPESDYYLNFTPRLFHHYLLLCQHLRSTSEGGRGSRSGSASDTLQWDEIPRVLAWMRSLDVRPYRNSLVLAMLEMGEVLPPGITMRNGEGPMAKWLGEWLGEESIPTEDELAESWRERRRWPDSGGH